MLRSPTTGRRLDLDLIEALVPEGASVLDLGCGDGELLERLCRHGRCTGRGIEIDEVSVVECIKRGVAVYHGDMLEGMGFYADQAFEVVILSQTLQQTSDPLRVIQEMLRVGTTAIISFPNSGYWRLRVQFLVAGRMPRSTLLPHPWHSTPDVHLCTIKDFRALCDALELERLREIFLVPPFRQLSPLLANWRAKMAIIQLGRSANGAGPTGRRIE